MAASRVRDTPVQIAVVWVRQFVQAIGDRSERQAPRNRFAAVWAIPICLEQRWISVSSLKHYFYV